MTKNHDKSQLKNNFSIIFFKSSISIFLLLLFSILFFVGGGLKLLFPSNCVEKFKSYDFQLHMIDVGQGDAILIKLPENKTMLIDSGSEEKSEKLLSYVKQYLLQEKLNKIDYLILTHPDEDHVGGAIKILQTLKVENLYRPKYYSMYESENLFTYEDYKVSDSIYYNQVILEAYRKGVNITYNEKGIKIVHQGCKVEFLSPSSDNYSSTNDYSAVIMVSYQNKKFLFTGDATSNIEKQLIEEYGENLKADVLKVGHHGSKTSSSQEFLDIVKPKFALITVGKENNYNLPSIEVTNRLHALDAKIMSTEELGSFAFSIVNDKIEIGYISKPICDMSLMFSITVILIFLIWAIPFTIKEIEKQAQININKKNKK